MTRDFTILVTFDDDECGRLPNEDELVSALAHSTAAEALSDATEGCAVGMCLIDPSAPERLYCEFCPGVDGAGCCVCGNDLPTLTAAVMATTLERRP